MITNKLEETEKNTSFQDVSKIISSLDKNIRSKKLYAANNPILKRHQEDLLVLLNTYLQMNNELDLLVDPFEMKLNNEVVYQNENRQENFAFKLYNEGIRSLAFKPGLTDFELDSFLKAFIHSTQKKENEDSHVDAVSALWEQEFEHIKYSVADTIVEESSLPGEKSMDQKIGEILDESMFGYQGTTESSKDDEFYQGINVTINPVSVGKMFQTHTVLNPDDLMKIRLDIAECERPERMLVDFVDMLLAVLMEETEEESFFSFIDYLGQALENALIQNQFHLSRILMELVNRFPTKPIPMFAANPNTMQEILRRLWSPSRVQMFVLSINESKEEDLENIETLISMMDAPLVSELLSSFDSVQDISRKKLILRGFSRVNAVDHVGLMLPYLSGRDSEQIRLGLYFLSLLKGDKVVDAIVKLIPSQTSAVKKEYLALLKKFPGEKSSEALMNALKDGDQEIRLHALKSLGITGDHTVAKRLGNTILSPTFANLDLNERKTYYMTVARITGNDFLPYLTTVFETKNWFSNQALNELYICGAFALQNIRTPEAKLLMEKIQLTGNKHMKQALTMVTKLGEAGKSK